MAWANKRISCWQVLRSWGIVYVGNFLGAIATAVLLFFTRQYMFGAGAIGLNVLNIAQAKCELEFVQALALGVACNALVCLAVWLCYSARTTTDKILSIIFPITAFVAAGFEHCVANMYFIPIGLFVKASAPTALWEVIGKTPADYASLTWGNFFFANLLPVTIGNIIGGSVMVGLVYWFIYIRQGVVPRAR
jgi:formate transporter